MDPVVAEKLITIGLIVIVMILLTRWAFRPVLNFSVKSIEYRTDDGCRKILRISNPKNYIPLRTGLNRVFIIVKDREISFFRSASGKEFDALCGDTNIDYFGFAAMVVRGKRLNGEPRIVSIDHADITFVNWHVTPSTV